MPSMLSQLQMIAVLAFGVLGAMLTAGGTYFLAARWRKRSAFPYCLSAFVFYALVSIATFQYGVLNSELGPEVASGWLLTVLILGQAAVTSIGVAIFATLVFGGYLFLMGELDYPVSRVKAYAGCAFFCLFFSMFLNPIEAARKDSSAARESLYQAALTNGSPEIVDAARRESERTLAALRAIGALARIDVTDTALIHHVKGQFIDLPKAEVEEYMRAALVHYILVEGGNPKRVVLREIGSDRQIALREPNGVFSRRVAAPAAAGDIPPGG